MQAEKIILETDANGHLKVQPQLPPNVRLEAIFLLVDRVNHGSQTQRQPSKRLYGKGSINGDITAPIMPETDWDALG